MRRHSSKDEFKIPYMQPTALSAEKRWTLARKYWAHIEHMMKAKKMLDNDNAEIWKFAEKQTLLNQRRRSKEEEQKSKDNKTYFRKIRNSAAHHKRDDQIKDWRREQELMRHMCKRSVRWTPQEEEDILFMSVPQLQELNVSEKSVPRPLVDYRLRPRCFFDLAIENDINLGRMIFELYGEYVPKTAANFLSLCKGCDGLSYKGSYFHRIIPNLMCQGGDITESNGSGGMTVFGEVFFKENYILKHGGAGVLSMTSLGPTKNSSMFNITFRELHALDGNSVVVGKIVKGINTLLKIEEFGYRTGKPRKKVVIINCGQI